MSPLQIIRAATLNAADLLAGERALFGTLEAGKFADILSSKASLTGQYLAGARRIEVPKARRPGNGLERFPVCEYPAQYGGRLAGRDRADVRTLDLDGDPVLVTQRGNRFRIAFPPG